MRDDGKTPPKKIIPKKQSFAAENSTEWLDSAENSQRSSIDSTCFKDGAETNNEKTQFPN